MHAQDNNGSVHSNSSQTPSQIYNNVTTTSASVILETKTGDMKTEEESFFSIWKLILLIVALFNLFLRVSICRLSLKLPILKLIISGFSCDSLFL